MPIPHSDSVDHLIEKAHHLEIIDAWTTLGPSLIFAIDSVTYRIDLTAAPQFLRSLIRQREIEILAGKHQVTKVSPGRGFSLGGRK